MIFVCFQIKIYNKYLVNQFYKTQSDITIISLHFDVLILSHLVYKFFHKQKTLVSEGK